jgi:hypothetical protein
MKVLSRYVPVLITLLILVVVVVLFPSNVKPGLSQGYVFSGQLIPKSDAPGTKGITVGGYKCSFGLRQVPWSSYAPLCQPKFVGNNGGATSFGVTGKTITVTFRYAVPPQEALILSIAKGVVGTEAQAVDTMKAYINLFNKDFELYGRHVVLKPFVGKGDFLQELSGLGQAGAQADAAEAKSLGAFADVSLLFSTAPYDQALASNHIIAITGGLYQGQSWFQENAPYVYSTSPDCNEVGNAAAAVMKYSMASLPAIFSNDPAMRVKQRVFGLIAPDNPIYQECANSTLKSLAQDHVFIKRVIGYNFNLTGASQLSANAMAQLQSAGVTTILCACDPLTPVFLTGQAQKLGYYPEWFTIDWGDIFGQLVNPAEWSYAISGGTPGVPNSQNEAYQVLKMTGLPKKDWSPFYASIYTPLLMLFDALQAAGPNLNPYTFEAGFWSLPPSYAPSMGVWAFHKGSWVAQASYSILYWDPQALSPSNDKKGAWEPCNNGEVYVYVDPTKGLKLHQQLQCGDRG